jgi:hypothetical protein
MRVSGGHPDSRSVRCRPSSRSCIPGRRRNERTDNDRRNGCDAPARPETKRASRNGMALGGVRAPHRPNSLRLPGDLPVGSGSPSTARRRAADSPTTRPTIRPTALHVCRSQVDSHRLTLTGRGGRPGTIAPRGCAHCLFHCFGPVPQRAVIDPRILGHLHDRPAGLASQPDRALLQVLAELPSRLPPSPLRLRRCVYEVVRGEATTCR